MKVRAFQAAAREAVSSSRAVQACRSARGKLAVALVLALSLVAPTASADFYLDRAQISGAPDDPFMTWRPYSADRARMYGSVALGYALNTLRMGALTSDPSIINRNETPFSNQVLAYVSAGIQANKRIGLELTLPIALVSSGGKDPIDDVGGGLDRGSSVMDTRVSLRLMGIESDDKTFRWGAGGAVFIPTGTKAQFAGDGETTSWIYTNFEFDYDSFRFVGMAGPHFRPILQVSQSELALASEVRMSFGLFVPMFDDRTMAGVEVWGQTGFGDVPIQDPNGNPLPDEDSFLRHTNTPFEWMAQVRRDMGSAKDPKDWYIQFGGGTRLTGGYGAADVRLMAQLGTDVWFADLAQPDAKQVRATPDRAPLTADPDQDGDGYPDAIDQCPTIKEDGEPPYPDDGCPDADRDDDGILDVDDKCPTDPEDMDGIEDEDGCPEHDADGDKIKDEVDACPLVKGVPNKDKKKHGCPKRKKIIVGKDAVELLEPIQFAYNSDEILKASFGILDEIVGLLLERDTMRLGVYGHTDSQGGPEYNKALSDKRAASVVRYLAKKGVANARLESAGYGLERPIASNDTEQGRAKNRRVEFKILRQ